MEKRLNLFILLLVVAVLVSGGLGYFLGQKGIKSGPASCESAFCRTLRSKAITNVSGSLFGKISEISGNDIFVEAEGEKTAVSISPETTFGRFSPVSGPDSKPLPPETIEFEDFAVGDEVSLTALFTPEGTIRATNVMALPKSPSPATSPLPAK